MHLWVVGKYIDDEDSGIVWEFGGVFDDKDKAIAACQNKYYFIGPVKLNKTLPEEAVEWAGAYYPVIEEE